MLWRSQPRKADLVADEQPDDQSLDAKTDRALSRNQAQGQWATLHDETAVFHGFVWLLAEGAPETRGRGSVWL